ncbi:MAG TPA: glycosyltransferase family 2 protein [Thermoanaerobaculia bacterium]|jgi:glycosyltransferase involved in cell wall biosynthesis|nr:glycosyltransferase family 2 protein [Thermoanaerobaculia bacterium]
MTRDLVSVVVPVYFNAESLPRLAERLRQVAASADWDIEAVFVDDGSGDESWARIAEVARSWPAARGVRLTRNFGSQMAILAGLSEAKGGAAAVLSADLQEPPELLPDMVAAWRRGATAVLAVRRSRPEGLATRAAAGFYYRTLRRLAFSQMPEGGFDCFLIGRPAVDFLVEAREVHTSLPGLLLWGGFPTALVPYDRVAREDGESRWTFTKKLKYFLDAVISFSYAPLRWMSVAGAGLAVLAFAYAVFLVAYKAVHGQPIAGWTSLMVALAFFSGVQLLSLGVLGEYLWRTLDAARARKGFLVRERTGGGPRSV